MSVGLSVPTVSGGVQSKQRGGEGGRKNGRKERVIGPCKRSGEMAELAGGTTIV